MSKNYSQKIVMTFFSSASATIQMSAQPTLSWLYKVGYPINISPSWCPESCYQSLMAFARYVVGQLNVREYSFKYEYVKL